MGFSQKEIAERLGVSQPMISHDIRKIKEQYKAAMVEDYAAQVQEKILQFRQLRAHMWKCYFKSFKKFRKSVNEFAPKKPLEDEMPPIRVPPNAKKNKGAKQNVVEKYIREFEIIRQTKTVETRMPKVEILGMIESVLCKECDLLGLWAPERVLVAPAKVDDIWAPLNEPSKATHEIDDVIAKLQQHLIAPTVTEETHEPSREPANEHTNGQPVNGQPDHGPSDKGHGV